MREVNGAAEAVGGIHGVGGTAWSSLDGRQVEAHPVSAGVA
jgi:hypothetical protein